MFCSTSLLTYIQNNSSCSILQFLQSFWLNFAKYIPYFRAIVEVWTNNGVIYQNKRILINKRSNSTNSTDSCYHLFTDLISITFPRQMLVNFYPESLTHINLFNLFIFNENIRMWIRNIFIMDFEPVNINSVLATLRLSLLAINHFLRFSKSEFTAGSRSVIKFAEAVKFVSSANNRGFVFLRQWLV